MKKEVKEIKENKKKNKLPLIIGVTILIIVIGVIGFIILNQNNNSIKGQFDKLLSSNKLEFIFFERKGNFESDEFKELLDTDLKEQGVTYTTIDVTNASYEDLEYFKEKLNRSSDNFDTPDISLPESISLKETSPVDSFDSNKLIGRINTLEILPVPVCIVSPSLGLADPISMYCPFNPV